MVGSENGEAASETLGEVVEAVVEAGDGAEVSVQAVLEEFGHRSFGPMILVPGALVATPLSGIPGLASTCAAIIALVAGQFLIGRSTPWLPAVLRRRRLSRARVDRATAPLRRFARLADRVVRPRLEFLTRGLAARGIALVCLALAVTMPPLEVVPFANSATGTAIAVFGLALVARDGVLVIAAAIVTAAAAALVARLLL